jgi:hypothetical protein
MEMDFHIFQSCALSRGHRRSAYFHTPGSTSGNSPIYCQERTLPHAWLFRRRFIFRFTHCCRWLFPNFGAQSYSTQSPICPIWEMSVNIGGLNLSQSPVFWTSSSGPRRVCPCTDLYVDGCLWLWNSLLWPRCHSDDGSSSAKSFYFLLLKKQFDRIRSTVPVQFSSVFNFHQHPPFPSRYDRDHVCLLDWSSGYLDHLPFPDMRDFNEDIADKIHE